MRPVIAAAVIVTALVANGGFSAALETDDGGLSTTGSEVWSEGAQVGVLVWSEGGVVSLPGVWPRCSWERLRASSGIAGVELPFGSYVSDGFLRVDLAGGRVGYVYVQECLFADGSESVDWVVIEEAEPVDVVDAARAELVELVPDPVVGMSPGVDINHLVGLATWVWLDEAPQSVTATVAIPGLSTTATATAVSLWFTPGDGGDRVECPLDAPVYSQDESAEPCAHTFERVSAHSSSGRWPALVEVEWEVTWTNTLGDSGTADPIVTSSLFELEVIELQARVIAG